MRHCKHLAFLLGIARAVARTRLFAALLLHLTIIFLQISVSDIAFAQVREIDSLKAALRLTLPDTTRVNILNQLARRLFGTNPAQMDTVAHEALSLAERSGYQRGMANAILQIGRSYYARGRYSEALEFFRQSQIIFTDARDTLGLASAWHALGNLYLDQTRYESALQHYLTALSLREAINDRRGVASTLNSLGILYKMQRKYEEALTYYRRSLALDEHDKNRSGVASCLNNIALLYQERQQYDSATLFLRQSLVIDKDLGRKSGIALSLNNLGVLFTLSKQYDSALVYLKEALRLKLELGDKKSIVFTQNGLAEVLRKSGSPEAARILAHEALDSARKLDAKAEIKLSAEQLAAAYKALRNDRLALFYTELSARYQDTLFNLDRDRDLSRLDAAYKLEKKQHENDRLRVENVAQQRLLLAVGVSACIALAFVVFLIRMNAHKRRTNEQLQEQQRLLEDQAQEIELANTALHEAHERSETLIRNTMPVSIANRLKAGETKIAERFENVCILFADIVGFTELASRLEPVVLVAILDEIFTAFDAIAARFGLEKIKTMGDAYMLVAGVPQSIAAPAETLALAALAMQEEITLQTDALRRMNVRLQVRIGIHAGEVVAGVIGTTKLVYDIWGDAVNIAHRMESHGIAGQIQVSEAFVQCFNTSIQEQIDASRKRLFAYPAMKSALPSAHTLASTPHEQVVSSSIIDTATAFIFEERGLIDMKGKGAMKAYLLSARSMNADV